MFWPTVPDGAADDMATRILLDALTQAPDGPVYRAVVEQAKVSEAVEGDSLLQQMAGTAMLQVRGFDEVPLDRVVAAVDKGLRDFRTEGLSAARLERLKAVREADLYDQVGSVLGKVGAIAESETLRRRPDYADQQLARLRAVSTADVMRAFDRYLGTRPRLEIGFAPKDQPSLALSHAETARVVEEAIVQGAEKAVDQASDRAQVARTPSSFDRSVEPPAGTAAAVALPAIWTASLPNGLALSGIEDRELPVARFEISIDAGQLRDDVKRPGVASLTAEMLTRGTRTKTREQLENALNALGAEVGVGVDEERTVIGGTTLSRNFAATMALVEEMLTQPRWDASELALAKAATTAGLQASRAEPSYLAEMVARQAIYGDGVLAFDPRGTPESVATLTMDDLQRFKATFYSPKAARVRVAGAVDQGTVSGALSSMASSWTGRALPPSGSIRFDPPERTRIYFYDVPGAKQSSILFARPGPARGDPAWFQARSANFILGGGGFASRLTQELRESKGYTYGVRSFFEGVGTGGRFTVASPVRANVTLEAATLMRDIVRDYGSTYTDADLELTKTSLQKARAREFETLQAKLSLLGDIGDYGLPTDVISRENAQLTLLGRGAVQKTARDYLDTDRMVVVVVGDAATQAGRLAKLGYGEPILLRKLR
jgi:zinc protease